VPDEAVAHDEHVVLLAEGDVFIGGVEVVLVDPGLNDLPLKHVLRADGVEVRGDDLPGEKIALFKLSRVEGRADTQVGRIRIFECGGRGRDRRLCLHGDNCSGK